MNQIEIEYFWPLSQQIPLDLDYPVIETSSRFLTGTSLPLSFGGTGSTSSFYTSTGKLTVNVDHMVFKVEKKPNIIRRGLFRVLGIKWEKK
jgi:hypothetical protein